MRAKVKAVFLGVEQNQFVDKSTGEVVEYRRATFNVRNTPETFVLSIPKDVNPELLHQYEDSFILVDFRFNNNNNNTFKGRLVNVYPDEKTMIAAPLLSQSESQNL